MHRLSETDNPSLNSPSKLTDKVGRIVHSKLKPFPFEIKTYYNISMHKIILEMEYFINSMIYQVLKFFKRITSFYPQMIIRPPFCFEDAKNTGLIIFNSLKQKNIIFNFFVNRN